MEEAQILRHIADNVAKGLGYTDGLLLYGNKIRVSTVVDWYNLLDNSRHISLAPKTHIVNGFEVPTPITDKPEIRSVYFIAMPTNTNWYRDLMWIDDKHDNLYFERNLCFSTKEAAIANAKAMLGIDPFGSEEGE